ncbi:MAG: M23 family metallopeptidase [Magnetococcales bacterium]|nr:M23 family metallopeptidase [Magnetococcales bacterium]
MGRSFLYRMLASRATTEAMVVTVTRASGSRHLAVPSFVPRLLPWLGGGAAVLLFLAGVWVGRPAQVVQTTPEIRVEELSTEVELLQQQNRELADRLTVRETALQELDVKLETARLMLGLVPPDPGLSLTSRMEMTLRELQQRGINQVADKKSPAESASPHLREASARAKPGALSARDLALRSMMFSSIPNGYPLVTHKVSSAFGDRFHPIYNRHAFHEGVDFGTPTGSRVAVTADGVVEAAEWQKAEGGLGLMVVVRHNFGFRTFYGHLSKALVSPGDFVAKGDLLGLSGSTGLSDGPHLHYEVRYLNHVLDPAAFLKWDQSNFDRIFQEKPVQWPSLIKVMQKKWTDQAPPSLQLAQK